MANLSKSLELMTDLIKAFDGEAPFKQHLATDRALATVRAAPKQPVAPVVPEHEQKLAAAHAKIEELKGVLRGALKHVRRHGQTSDHGYITTSDTGDKWVSHSGGLRGHIEESLK